MSTPAKSHNREHHHRWRLIEWIEGWRYRHTYGRNASHSKAIAAIKDRRSS